MVINTSRNTKRVHGGARAAAYADPAASLRGQFSPGPSRRVHNSHIGLHSASSSRFLRTGRMAAADQSCFIEKTGSEKGGGADASSPSGGRLDL